MAGPIEEIPRFHGLMRGTATVQRFNQSALNAWGEPSGEWEPVATGVRCSIQDNRMRPTLHGIEVIQYDFYIYIDWDPEFTPQKTDRLIDYEIDGNTDGHTYEFIERVDAIAQNDHWKIGARRVEVS